METENENTDNIKGRYVKEVPIWIPFDEPIPPDAPRTYKMTQEFYERMCLEIKNCKHEFYNFGRNVIKCWKCGTPEYK